MTFDCSPTNAELLALAGPRSAYEGKLGVVAEGALADLLLVDADPIANIRLIEDPAKNFVLIMKDGCTRTCSGREGIPAGDGNRSHVS